VVNGSIAVIKTDYASFQGTSMATPHVVGVAALVRAANKSLTPAQVRTLLKSTATQLSGPNDENQLGSGLVNAEAAVTQAVHMLPFQQVAN
jgi:subtilisin family serine protease